MRRFVAVSLLLSWFGAAACSPLASIGMRTGGNVPRPKDCEIQFKYQSVNKPLDTSRYTLVGQVSVDFADAEWSEAMKSAVRPKACELGGEVAAIWAWERTWSAGPRVPR
jgi:hypothetical protein